MKATKQHHLYYLLLSSIFVFLFALILLIGGTRQIQLLFAITGAFVYVVCGIFHHLHNHDVSVRVLLEYVSVAMLGIAVLYFVFQIQ